MKRLNPKVKEKTRQTTLHQEAKRRRADNDSEEEKEREDLNDIDLPHKCLAQHASQLLAKIDNSCLPVIDNRRCTLGLIVQATMVCILSIFYLL